MGFGGFFWWPDHEVRKKRGSSLGAGDVRRHPSALGFLQKVEAAGAWLLLCPSPAAPQGTPRGSLGVGVGGGWLIPVKKGPCLEQQVSAWLRSRTGRSGRERGARPAECRGPGLGASLGEEKPPPETTNCG